MKIFMNFLGDFSEKKDWETRGSNEDFHEFLGIFRKKDWEKRVGFFSSPYRLKYNDDLYQSFPVITNSYSFTIFFLFSQYDFWFWVLGLFFKILYAETIIFHITKCRNSVYSHCLTKKEKKKVIAIHFEHKYFLSHSRRRSIQPTRLCYWTVTPSPGKRSREIISATKTNTATIPHLNEEINLNKNM